MTVKVRFLMPWRQYSVGQVIEPTPGQAAEMVRRGVVEYVVEEKPKKGKRFERMVPETQLEHA